MWDGMKIVSGNEILRLTKAFGTNVWNVFRIASTSSMTKIGTYSTTCLPFLCLAPLHYHVQRFRLDRQQIVRHIRREFQPSNQRVLVLQIGLRRHLDVHQKLHFVLRVTFPLREYEIGGVHVGNVAVAVRQIVREVPENAFPEVLQAAEGATEDFDVVPDAERVEAEGLGVFRADAAVDVVVDSIGGD